MKIKIKNDFLIVKRRFFENSMLFFLPTLLLFWFGESQYQKTYLYMVLVVIYIWLYFRQIINPILFLDSDILSFRKNYKYTYLKGFLIGEGVDYKLTKIPLKSISNVDFDYPVISVFQYSERFEIELKVSYKEFELIKKALIKKLDVLEDKMTRKTSRRVACLKR